MLGYLNRPDATAEMIDADGWLHTGDIGHCDEDGFLFVTDRLKELIKRKGRRLCMPCATLCACRVVLRFTTLTGFLLSRTRSSMCLTEQSLHEMNPSPWRHSSSPIVFCFSTLFKIVVERFWPVVLDFLSKKKKKLGY